MGAVSYLQLLVAQQQAQQTRISPIGSRAQRLADTAALFQAMDGSWSHGETISTPVTSRAAAPD